jgi:hypothetical protein
VGRQGKGHREARHEEDHDKEAIHWVAPGSGYLGRKWVIRTCLFKLGPYGIRPYSSRMRLSNIDLRSADRRCWSIVGYDYLRRTTFRDLLCHSNLELEEIADENIYAIQETITSGRPPPRKSYSPTPHSSSTLSPAINECQKLRKHLSPFGSTRRG